MHSGEQAEPRAKTCGAMTGVQDQGWGSADGCPEAAAGTGFAAHAAGRGVYNSTKAARSRLHSRGDKSDGVNVVWETMWAAERLRGLLLREVAQA